MIAPTEDIIRTDLVAITRGAMAWKPRPGKRAWPRYIGQIRRMTITASRINIGSAYGSWDTKLGHLLLLLFYRGNRYWWFWRSQSFEIADVNKVWTWQPELSAAPLIDLGAGAHDAFTYLLLERSDHRPVEASLECLAEHVTTIERLRAATHEQRATNP